jgi:hypothetical protein
MAVIGSLTKAYAQAIYLDGTKKFSDIRPEYVEPVKQHSAANYSDTQIQNALDNGWISEQEYQATIALKVNA